MINIEFLDVSADQLPADKYYEFDGTTYTFRLKYNDLGLFFTVEIFDALNKTFLFSNKVVYGGNLIDSLNAPFGDKIIPLNLDILQGITSTEEINDETFGDKIKLYTSISEA